MLQVSFAPPARAERLAGAKSHRSLYAPARGMYLYLRGECGEESVVCSLNGSTAFTGT